jgi:hypothetical protein
MFKPPASPKLSGGCLKWPSIALIVITAILCGTALKGCDRLKAIVDAWTSAFGRSDISTSFRENIRKVSATHGDILELATVEADETFTRMDAKNIVWDLIYLGTTVSEIRAPAVYRYHLKLSDGWQISQHEDTCVVIAPVIRPSLPPAIRTDKMEKKTQAGWGRFNAAENLQLLEQSITPVLERRAGNATHLDQIREPARQATAEFVKTWVVKDMPSVTRIVVVFADEPAAQAPQELRARPATLNLVP